MVKDGLLECLCENDYDKDKLSENEFRIGLKNLEKRLELLYNDTCDFRITKGETFIVHLKLNLV